jgi:hypothetical protein
VAATAQADAAQVLELDVFNPVIDEILHADLDAPRKQRHTVTRIYDRLIGEHGMRDVSYSVVRRYIADRKRRSVSRRAADRSTCSSRRPTVQESSKQAFWRAIIDG